MKKLLQETPYLYNYNCRIGEGRSWAVRGGVA